MVGGSPVSPASKRGWSGVPRHLLRLAGNLSYQDGTLGYDGLVELRLFFFWLNLHLGWVGEGEGGLCWRHDGAPFLSIRLR